MCVFLSVHVYYHRNREDGDNTDDSEFSSELGGGWGG